MSAKKTYNLYTPEKKAILHYESTKKLLATTRTFGIKDIKCLKDWLEKKDAIKKLVEENKKKKIAMFENVSLEEDVNPNSQLLKSN